MACLPREVGLSPQAYIPAPHQEPLFPRWWVIGSSQSSHAHPRSLCLGGAEWRLGPASLPPSPCCSSLPSPACPLSLLTPFRLLATAPQCPGLVPSQRRQQLLPTQLGGVPQGAQLYFCRAL